MNVLLAQKLHHTCFQCCVAFLKQEGEACLGHSDAHSTGPGQNLHHHHGSLPGGTAHATCTSGPPAGAGAGAGALHGTGTGSGAYAGVAPRRISCAVMCEVAETATTPAPSGGGGGCTAAPSIPGSGGSSVAGGMPRPSAALDDVSASWPIGRLSKAASLQSSCAYHLDDTDASMAGMLPSQHAA